MQEVPLIELARSWVVEEPELGEVEGQQVEGALR